jgi:NAD(P)-dependent dehydrogenase (short-subunit alcohol dehydrogenase family)
MHLGLQERAAIVTGGSRGIGRQVAVDLAGEGCDVLLCARDAAALAGVASEVRDRGARAEVLSVDLTDPAAAAAVVDTCGDAFGKVDILVNNAGVATPKRLAKLTAADWQEGFELNFFAAARLAVACIEPMRNQRWGRIVNVSSTYGKEPDPLFAPYGAAKAAMLNLTKSLARGYSADGVTTNAVIPGITLTEMVEGNAASAAGASGTTVEEVMAKMMAKDPVAMGRFGATTEVSAAILFLVSEQASWISGAALAVDGSTLRSI